MVAPAEKRARLSLSRQVIFGLLLGIAVGIFFGEMVGWTKIVGDIFIKLLQITVIPYISFSLITGLGELNYEVVRRLALKGGGILLLIWTIAIVIVVLMPLSFPDWPSASFFSASLVEEAARPDFLRMFIPSNPFYSFANAVIPAIVVFSILIGITLIGIPGKQAFIDPLIVLRQALMRITSAVAKLAPIGVFGLMAHAAGTTDIADLARLQVYIVLYALLALTFGLWVLPGLVAILTPLKYRDILRALRTPLITAFATGSSLVVLPLLMEQCKFLIAESKMFDSRVSDDADTSVEVLIPSFYTFPSPGTLLTLSFVLFAGWYIGSDISAANYLMLILVGLPTLFGGALLAIPFLLDLVRLPSDLFQVFVTIDVINSRFGTYVSAMHYATIGLIGTVAMVGRLRFNVIRILRFATISTLLIGVILIGVNAFYSHVVVVPYTKAEALRSLHLLGNPQSATVVDSLAPDNVLSDGDPASLAQILERGTVRICFQPDEYPSAFYNNAQPAMLVGFDIEMAHRFAERMDLTIEFIPAPDEIVAARRLDKGACDIYMRTLPIAAHRTKTFALTEPVYMSSVGLIVRDYRRDEFRSWNSLDNLGDSLRLAIEYTPGNLIRSETYFPKAEILPIADMDVQRRLLETDGEGFDAIMDMAEEGAAWTVLYPSYNLVVPKPTRFLPVAYAVARDNQRLLTALNAWLLAEKSRGTVDSLYSHWMLGEAAKSERPPRWSVIRNVLGWVD
ncbi:MAG: cation:dicarboxylate symporter family transporter [Gammaproteobacteria bacterium]